MFSVLYILFLLYFSIISILSIIGNSVVLITISTYSSLQNKTNFFLASLACIDLTFGAFATPIWVPVQAMYHFSRNHSLESVSQNTWIKCCQAATFGYTLGAIGEGIGLLMIAFDRLLYISQPLRYSVLLTTSRGVALIGVTWVVSIGSAFLITFYSSGTIHREYGCLPTKVFSKEINNFFASPFFALIVTLLCLVYGRISYIAWQKSQTQVDNGQTNVQARKSAQAKITKMVMPILSIYLLTSFLYCVAILGVRLIHSEWATVVEYLGLAVSHTNHWTNCIIYTYR